MNISCCGIFNFVPFFDASLRERFRIEFPPEFFNGFGSPGDSGGFLRVCRVKTEDGNDRQLVAVSPESPMGHFGSGVQIFGTPGQPIVVCDVETRRVLAQMIAGQPKQVYGMASISGNFVSSPKIAAAWWGMKSLTIHDALSGELVVEFPEEQSPMLVFRMICVEEWTGANSVDLFCGTLGMTVRLDVEKLAEVGRYDIKNLKLFRGLSVDVSNRLLLAGSDDEIVHVWSVDEYSTEVQQIQLNDRCFCCHLADPDENPFLLAVGTVAGRIEIFDLRKTEKRMNEFAVVLSNSSNAIVEDLDHVGGDEFVSCHSDRTVSMWSAFKGIKRKKKMPGSATGVCVLRDEVLEGEITRQCVARVLFASELCQMSAQVSIQGQWLLRGWMWAFQ